MSTVPPLKMLSIWCTKWIRKKLHNVNQVFCVFFPSHYEITVKEKVSCENRWSGKCQKIGKQGGVFKGFLEELRSIRKLPIT